MLKSKIFSILDPILVKATESGIGGKVFNKQIVESIIICEKDALKFGFSSKPGCYIRILAKNFRHACEIENKLQASQELEYECISKHDAPFVNHKKNEENLYNSSVIVKFRPFEILKTLFTSSNQFCDLRRQITLENNWKRDHVLIDFSSPNIAKPFHYGHLKSTILGNFLANLNEFFGNETTRLNYIGDWGTQFGLLSLGLEQFGSQDELKISSLRHLVDIYVEANRKSESDKAFHDEAKKRFLSMDNGSDKTLLNSWREIRSLSICELERSYKELGVHFDEWEFESDYSELAKKITLEMQTKGLIEVQANGALTVRVNKKNTSLSIPMLKEDGSSLYISRDVAAAIERRNKYKFNKSLYVAGCEQEKHFYCLINVLKQLNYDWHEDIVHVKTGKVRGLSTRSGKIVFLKDILDEATRCYINATKKTVTSKVSTDNEIEDVGKHLALSALFVYDMQKTRSVSYDLHWDQVMLAGSGSGINLQTTYARLCSLIDKSKYYGVLSDCYSYKDAEAAVCVEAANLLSTLNCLDTALYMSYYKNDASPLVRYALELTRAVNRARQADHLRVLGGNNNAASSLKLDLFIRARETLELIIRLIGLKPLQKV